MTIDTHCHLYSNEFSEDIDLVIQHALEKGTRRFYLPAIDSETHEAMLSLEKKYPANCFAMIGLHPCSVKENYREELKMVEDLLGQRKFAAIGECGLDLYWDKSFASQQVEALEQQILLAKKYQLPIVLHTRNAMTETIEIIQKHKDENLKGIFHCFGGTLEEANQIIGMGFYLGIGGVITYKNSGLAEVIREVSLDHLVLETDAPYLTPVPFRGKRNESSYLSYIAQKLAEIQAVPVETVELMTTRNAENIFGK